MNEGLVLIDPELKVLQLNEAAKKLFKASMQANYMDMDIVRLTRSQEEMCIRDRIYTLNTPPL